MWSALASLHKSGKMHRERMSQCDVHMQSPLGRQVVSGEICDDGVASMHNLRGTVMLAG
jgi:hypothetical protein